MNVRSFTFRNKSAFLFAHNFILLFLVALIARYLAFNELVKTYARINYMPGESRFDKVMNVFGELNTVLLKGIASDVAICAILALVLLKLPRVLSWLIVIGLLLLYAANTSHIVYNMSNLSLSLGYIAADASFLKGSGFDILFLRTILYGALFLILYAILNYFLREKRVVEILHAAVLLVVPVVTIVWAAGGSSLEYDAWLQKNVIEENVQVVFSNAGNDEAKVESTGAESSAYSNEAGEVLVNPNPQSHKSNVLIIFVESLSQYHLDANVAPRIRELSEKNIRATQFIAPQLQTHRGLYSAFCADYPNFSAFSSKSMIVAKDEAPDKASKGACLPRILSGDGYDTWLLKSASLDFTDARAFAEKAGFTHSASALEENFPAKSKNAWGIDDDSFYRFAETKIDELVKKGEPWFLATVSSGTHAPYNVPADYSAEGLGSSERAFSFADFAVGEFVDRLKRKGVLDNTLLIITADESRTFTAQGSPLYRDLILNWIPFIVIPPKQSLNLQIDSPYTLVDVPATILDYLNIDQRINGRSVFRRYESFRPLTFGNVYKHHVFVLDSANSMRKCNTSTFQCFDIEIIGDGVFDDRYHISDVRTRYSAELKTFIYNNDWF